MTPRAIRRPCSTPGCPYVAEKGGKCVRHTKLVARQYDQMRKRNDPHSTFPSDRKWREFRAAYLRVKPWCAICGRAATQVHHPIPRRMGGNPYDPSNCQQLCLECHSRIEALSGNRWGKRR